MNENDGSVPEDYLGSLKEARSRFGENSDEYATELDRTGEILYSQGNLVKALECYYKALEIKKRAKGEGHPDVAASLNIIGVIYRNQGNLVKALKYHEKALEIRKSAYGEKHPDVATSLNNIGLVYCSQGNLIKALGYHEKALEIEKRVYGEEHPEVAGSLNNTAVVYYSQGNLIKALECYFRALEIWKNVFGGEHISVAIFLNNIGLVYSSQGNLIKALEYHEKALEIRKNILGEVHPDVAQSLNNIGLIYEYHGTLDKALEYHEKALEIWKRTYGEDHPDVASSLNNIGAVYNKLDNLVKALEYLEKALEIRKRISGEEHPVVATYLNNIGEVYLSQGNLVKALEYHEKALEIRNRVLGEEHADVALSLNNIGEFYRTQGNLVKALEYHEKALEIRKRTYGEDHPDVAQSLNNIGAVHGSKGNPIKALEYHEKALVIRKTILGEEHPDVATSFYSIGADYYSQGNLSNALEYYEKSLEIRKRVYGDTHPFVIGILKNIGDVYCNQGNLEKAQITYEKSIEILKVTTQKIEEPDDKFRILGEYYDLFSQAISVINATELELLTKDKIEKSLWVIESSKASQLLLLFQDSKALRISGIPGELIDKDSLLRDQIRQYGINIDKAYAEGADKNKERIKNFKNQLFSLQEKHRNFIKEIEKKYPKYFDLKYQTRTAEIEDIQSFLNPQEALLNYLLDTGKNIVYILYISQDTSDIKVAGSNDDLELISNDFVSCIKNRDFGGTLRNGSLLYVTLIDPVRSTLEEEKINKLVIIPDHILFNVPFEVLIHGEFWKKYNLAANEERMIMEEDIPYLIKSFSVSYHFSATLFCNLRKEKASKAGEGNFIGFAPVFDDEFCREFRLPDFLDGTDRIPDKLRSAMRGDRTITPLPYTREEVMAASGSFGHDSGPMLSNEAKKEAFISQVRGRNIVMASTHGYYHRQSPELSGLIFYPVETQETDEYNPVSGVDPYILFTGETYNLPLQDASLVILSCCETALGDLKRGEGIIGLSRGFLYSGSSSVACSLWKVNDERTAELWKEFFAQYKEEIEPNYPTLLQKAKIKMIEKGIDPFYWGAFVMIGKG